eukprot:Plantae.Rhodophyta-Hildenbrandia_rubra.ctg13171.p2 GENE.Plantae.Rhodophyta-Hildenbrandia_rubra.ctg13171~~Plantae.Rhodophyta-Hildenbrandia_rubra.ctg13171.p2  ORF type:complete len:175 (-),score=19.80 Plantae.Rhodophyta-Hildenbrandia_rubra.ctg13171:126-650(-)
MLFRRYQRLGRNLGRDEVADSVTKWARLEMLDAGEALDKAIIASSSTNNTGGRSSRSRCHVAAAFASGPDDTLRRYCGRVEQLFFHELHDNAGEGMLAKIHWARPPRKQGDGVISRSGAAASAFTDRVTVETVAAIDCVVGLLKKSFITHGRRREKVFILDNDLDALLESHGLN